METILRRATAGTAVALAAAAALSGCTPDLSPRVRMEGDTPTVVVCSAVIASEVEVLVGLNGSDPADGLLYWRVEGSHSFRAGDSIMAGVVPDGMTEKVALGIYDPKKDDLIVSINPVDPDDEIHTTWLAAGSVSSGQWSNGNPVDKPCG
jgi:hypothetical protein